MRFRCETHKIEVVVENKRRRFSGLSWSGTPPCKLFTMKEIREGRFGECEIKRVG